MRKTIHGPGSLLLLGTARAGRVSAVFLAKVILGAVVLAGVLFALCPLAHAYRPVAAPVIWNSPFVTQADANTLQYQGFMEINTSFISSEFKADGVSLTLKAPAQKGVVTLSEGLITYKPRAGYLGEDAFQVERTLGDKTLTLSFCMSVYEPKTNSIAQQILALEGTFPPLAYDFSPYIASDSQNPQPLNAPQLYEEYAAIEANDEALQQILDIHAQEAQIQEGFTEPILASVRMILEKEYYLDPQLNRLARNAHYAAQVYHTAYLTAPQSITDRIQALPPAEAVTVHDGEAIAAARWYYDGLTERQKEKVSADTLALLSGCEAALQRLQSAQGSSASSGSVSSSGPRVTPADALAAQKVRDLIFALPFLGSLTSGDESLLKDALGAYGMLTEAQKPLVGDAALRKLEALEKAMQDLPETADNASAARRSAAFSRAPLWMILGAAVLLLAGGATYWMISRHRRRHLWA